MKFKDLVTDIMNELTFSGAMPFKMPVKEVERIITNAKRYFYDYWRYALQKTHLIIPVEVFKNPNFEKQRGLFLPECIQYVTECEECKGTSIFGNIDRDFGDQKFVGSELFLTPFMGETIVYRLAMFSFLDISRNLTITTVSYDYNNGTHFLQLLGRTPKAPLHLAVSKKIEDEYLYDLELFQRYCRAKAKVRLHELISITDFQLPGGFKWNYTQLSAIAEKELEDIKNTIDNENVADYMFVENY